MRQNLNHKPSKKPTNVSINSDLLAKAKELKINLSATLEQALIYEIKAAEREKWLNDNKEAIEELNEITEKYGLFSDGYRVL